MKTIELSEVSALTSLLQADAEPIFVTKNGHTVGAVLPASDEDVESILLSINPKFQEILERSQRRLQTEGALSGDEVREQLGLPPANAG